MRNVEKVLKIWKMKNFEKTKAKTSKAKISKTKTSKAKTPKCLSDESFVFVFSRQSISVASAEFLKSVKNLKNEEFQKVESWDLES